MKLAFGCDPNAFEMKAALIDEAKSLGHEVVDYPSDDPIYANVAVAVATDVAAGKADRGVLVCGTGIGVSIAANKVKGAYCACVADVYQAQRASLSNNAGVSVVQRAVATPDALPRAGLLGGFAGGAGTALLIAAGVVIARERR